MSDKKQWGKRLSSETKDRLDSLLESFSSADEMINAALDALQNAKSERFDLDLDDDDQKLVSRAVDVTGLKMIDLMKKGLIAESKRWVSSAEKHNLANLSDEELRGKKVAGSAFTRIERAVKQLMEYNDNQTDRNERIAITPSSVFQVTNANRKTVNQWCELNKADIEEHLIRNELAEYVDGELIVDSKINLGGKVRKVKKELGFD